MSLKVWLFDTFMVYSSLYADCTDNSGYCSASGGISAPFWILSCCGTTSWWKAGVFWSYDQCIMLITSTLQDIRCEYIFALFVQCTRLQLSTICINYMHCTVYPSSMSCSLSFDLCLYTFNIAMSTPCLVVHIYVNLWETLLSLDFCVKKSVLPEIKKLTVSHMLSHIYTGSDQTGLQNGYDDVASVLWDILPSLFFYWFPMSSGTNCLLYWWSEGCVSSWPRG